MKRIMILGAGTMQLPAYEAARRNGWTAIAVDGDSRAPAREVAAHFLHIDLKDSEAILRAAEREAGDAGLHGVFTVGTDFSYPVARVADALGLPGVGVEAARRASDKVLMRRSLAEAGIAVPRFLELDHEAAPWRVAEEGMLPAVVKPVDNMGARGVRRVDSVDELPGAVAAARAHSRSGRVIVEELIDGVEYSIDALVDQGRVYVTGVADRHVHFPPYFIELGHTMPAALSDAERHALEAGFRAAVEALGMRTGAAKGDLFLSSTGEVVIGELAARLSGGYMSGWTYPYATGIPLVEKAMRLAVGDAPGVLQPRFSRASAERAAVSIPGIVRRIHGETDLWRTPGVRDLFLRCAAGEAVRMPRNNTEKVANVIAAGDSRSEAVAAAENAVSTLFVELEPGRPETLDYLFRSGSRFAGGSVSTEHRFPDFFPEPTAGTRATLQDALRRLLDGDRRRDGGVGHGGEEGHGRRSRDGRTLRRSMEADSAALPLSPTDTGGLADLIGSAGEGADSASLDQGNCSHRGAARSARDWNYRTVSASLEMLRRRRGVHFVRRSEGPSSPWAVLLLYAMMRGGLQGAVFVIDTVREHPGVLEEYLESWLVELRSR